MYHRGVKQLPAIGSTQIDRVNHTSKCDFKKTLVPVFIVVDAEAGEGG